MEARDVTFGGDGPGLGGYLAMPAGEGAFPGVVVIHEAYSLNENIREIAERFAGEGYAALAVDLFSARSRAVCMARFMAGMLRGSPARFGIADLQASFSYLSAMPQVDRARIAAIGFCMGGAFVIAWPAATTGCVP
jgi:carboxymethylenebutenolidase